MSTPAIIVWVGASVNVESDGFGMELGPQHLGKWLIVTGVVIALIGGLIVVLGRIGLFKLPGDLEFGGKNWRLYLPIASCIIISIVLTLILWLISHFRR